MSKFILCSQKGIQKYINSNKEFQANYPVNLDMICSIRQSDWLGGENYRPHYDIEFLTIRYGDVTWRFETKEERDRTYDLLMLNYIQII